MSSFVDCSSSFVYRVKSDDKNEHSTTKAVRELVFHTPLLSSPTPRVNCSVFVVMPNTLGSPNSLTAAVEPQRTGGDSPNAAS